MRLYHTQLCSSDIGKYVLLPGNPDRVEAMAQYLENPRFVMRNREYCTWNGEIAGQTVSIVSTGIGGPSAAIALEELIELGAHTFIRTGTCGMIQPNSQRGDLFIPTGCVRGGGTTLAYVPVQYPAVAHPELVQALKQAAKRYTHRAFLGITECKDAFYLETPEKLPLCQHAQDQWRTWERAQVLATEMESDTLFVIASIRNVRAASVLFGLGSCDGVVAMDPMTQAETECLSKTGIEALRICMKNDSSALNS
ncbi:MAG: nucleoside phosphorylase [Proteobacteria bacterium]|nr:nucleoside phosphorylase [Pseudomonadota bacterium]